MNAVALDRTADNSAWPEATPRLSVLIPYLNDDPCTLLHALGREAEALGGTVEVVLLDDGSGDDALADRVIAAIHDSAIPARSVRLFANEGRARGRNRLAANARAGHLLFLDSDMLPDAPDFLVQWIDLVDRCDPAVAFGGFSLKQAPLVREHALHRQMAMRSDCAGAEQRRLKPEKYVFTSNLMIRRAVFEAEPFDEGFKGWGWEDVEWGVRVSRRHPIVHVDNPATHLGLDPPMVIAAKYEQSAANFARILRAHPDIVRGYPSYKVARALKLAPLRWAWRPLLKALALTEQAPLPMRAFCMRLYRAAVCAEAI